MKFYLLSDNVDTIMGMRLAGVEGELVQSADTFRSVLERAMDLLALGIKAYNAR